jgi:hypothetical protein
MGAQTFSAEFACAPQVKQTTVGLSVMCAISWVAPLLFSMHIWPVCLDPHLQVVVASMMHLALAKLTCFVDGSTKIKSKVREYQGD